MINKNTKNMNESMFSAIDLIRQDSKDVRDFVKKVFSDKEFKSMSKDTDFIKYLKSIYEGTMIDEESVYISTRNSNGTITTHIKESVVKEAITPPNSKKVEALKKAVQKINRKYKVQISTHPVTKGEVEIELGSGNHPDNDYNTIDKLVKKLGIKQYSVFNESVNEGKYNYKADALTAYFKGKIDAKELDKIARDDFKSGIATKKELSNFLSNKFTQDVMSDTYGIPAGTLVKRVRGLMKFAEGIGESVVNEATPFHVLFKVKKDISNRSIKPATASYKSESDAKKFLKSVKKDGGKGMIVRRNENSTEDGVPQGYNPMVEDKSEIKGLLKKVGNKETKFYDVLSAMEKKYGKSKYRTWLEKSLKDFGVNSKHYDYRTNGAAEEKLFQLGKK